MMETISNIVEDPSCDPVSKLLCDISVGYFIKHCDNSEESIKNCLTACGSSLTYVFDLNPKLVEYNISRNVKAIRYSRMLVDRCHESHAETFNHVNDTTGISKVYDMVRGILKNYSDYQKELELFQKNMAILHFKRKSISDFPNPDDAAEYLKLISASRFEYPPGGLPEEHRISFKPIVCEQAPPLREVLSQEVKQKLGFDGFLEFLKIEPEYCVDTVPELVVLSYILSPNRVIRDDECILFALIFSQLEKISMTIDYQNRHDIEMLFEEIDIGLEKEIRTLGRTGYAFMMDLLSLHGMNPTKVIRKTQTSILSLCRGIDYCNEIEPDYKNRLSIGSCLNTEQQMIIQDALDAIAFTDSEETRKNRMLNMYDLESCR